MTLESSGYCKMSKHRGCLRSHTYVDEFLLIIDIKQTI